MADVTGWATVGLAASTVVVASVGIWQATITRRSLKLAGSDHQESIKARIDQRAPHVTLSYIGANRVCVEWLTVIGHSERDHRYELPRHRLDTVALAGWFEIDNHGPTLAEVDIPSGCVTFAPEDVSQAYLYKLVKELHSEAITSFSLAPGEKQILVIEGRRTIEEWVNQFRAENTEAEAVVEVLVRDTYAEGIQDVTRIHFRGFPLARVSDTQWSICDAPQGIDIDRTKRSYLGLSRPET